jgi:DNA mismatch repair protein MutS
VVRIVTPGTVTDAALLDERRETLLAAVAVDGERFGLAWLELSAGRFTMLEGAGAVALAAELERLHAAEILWPDGGAPGSPRRPACCRRAARRGRPPWHFELASASRLLTDQLGTLDLRGYGADTLPLAIAAAGALLQYVRDTQKSALPHIRALRVEERGDALQIDAATRRNLELDAGQGSREDASLIRCWTSPRPRWGRARCAAGSAGRSRRPRCCAHATRPSARWSTMRRTSRCAKRCARSATSSGSSRASRCASARPRDLTGLRGSLAALPGVRRRSVPIARGGAAAGGSRGRPHRPGRCGGCSTC